MFIGLAGLAVIKPELSILGTRAHFAPRRFGSRGGLRAERTCRSSCQTRPKSVRPVQGLLEMQTPSTFVDSGFTKYLR